MISQTISTRPSCEDCPLFHAYEGDTKSRGNCGLFDKVTRGYWEMTQDCQNNLDEVIVTLHTQEQEIDPEDGTPNPRDVQTLSIFLPHDDVNLSSILDTLKQYQEDFVGYILADWYWANNPECEF